jgi:hypothetical protein
MCIVKDLDRLSWRRCPKEVRKFVQTLQFKDRIITHRFVVVCLRPDELFPYLGKTSSLARS